MTDNSTLANDSEAKDGIALWCTEEDISSASARLRDEKAKIDFKKIAQAATRFVRNDVFSHVDLYAIDSLLFAPQPLVHLTAIKAQELAWVEFFGSSADEQYELVSAGKNYQRKLDALLKDIRDGRLDRFLQKPKAGIAPEREGIQII